MQTLSSSIDLASIPAVTDITAIKITVINFLYFNRSWVVLGLAILIGFLNAREDIWGPRKNYQAVIYNELKNIREDCFKNNQSQIRVTVFKKASWFEASLHYIFHTYIKFITIRLLPERGFLSSWRRLPIPFSSYLIIFARIGTPSRVIHSTIFRITDDAEKIEGVVGFAWRTHKSLKVELPDIRNIEKLKKYKKLEDIEESPEKTSIKEYMEKGNIHSYRKLKSIHRYSVSFWAKLICDPGNEPWGVIVIDSSEKDIIEKCDAKKLDEHTNKIREIITRHYKNV